MNWKKWGIGRKLNIQIKLFISSLIIMLAIFFLVSNAFYIFVSKLIIDDQIEFDMFAFEKASERFETVHRELDRNIEELNESEELLALLYNSYEGKKTDVINEKMNCLENLSIEIFMNNDFLEEIIVLGENGFFFSGSKDSGGKYIGKIDDYNTVYNKIQSSFFNNSSHANPIYIDDKLEKFTTPEEILIYNTIKNNMVLFRNLSTSKQENFGCVFFVYNLNFLKGYFPSNQENSTVILYNQNNQPIWVNNDNANELYNIESYSLQNKNFLVTEKNNKQVLVTQQSLNNYKYKITKIVPIATIYSEIDKINKILYWGLVLIILYVFLVSMIKPKRISTPFIELQEQIKRKRNNLLNQFEAPQIHGRLFNKIVMFFVISTFIPGLILLFFTFNFYQNAYKTKLIDYVEKATYLTQNSVDYDLGIYNNRLKQIVFNEEVQNLLDKSNEKWINEMERENLQQIMQNIQNTKDDYINLTFYNNNNKVIYSTQYFGNYESSDDNSLKELEHLKSSSGELIFQGITEDYYNRPQLSFARKINYIDSVYNPLIGYAKIDISLDAIKEKIEGNIESWFDYFLVGANDNQCIVLDKNRIGQNQDNFEEITEFALASSNKSKTKRKSGNIIANHKSELYNIHFYTVISNDTISKTLSPLYWYSTIIILAMIAIMIGAAFFTTFSLVIPFKKLLDALGKEINNKNANIRLNIYGYDEIGMLSRQFNTMVDEMDALMEENYTSKIREKELLYLQKEAQFNALQQQINPHFLYNTLDSINWMAYKHGAKDVCKMVTSLAKFFRGVIANEDIITIEEEIKHLNEYIYIQKQRFQDRIQFEITVDDEILEMQTIKLLLQPIVENAIIHGIEGRKETGIIKIKGYRNDDNICFEIADDGFGMNEKQLDAVRNNLRVEKHTKRSIGMANVYKRLKFHFGEKIVFKINSTEGKGTHVTLAYKAKRL